MKPRFPPLRDSLLEGLKDLRRMYLCKEPLIGGAICAIIPSVLVLGMDGYEALKELRYVSAVTGVGGWYATGLIKDLLRE